MTTIDELYPNSGLDIRNDHRPIHERLSTKARTSVYAADYGENIADAAAEVIRRGGGDVILSPATYSISAALPLAFGMNYIGQGWQTYLVAQSGVSVFTNTTGERVQRASIRHMRLGSVMETGTAIDFYDCSKCIAEDVFIGEFSIGIHLHGSVGGYAAYNRFRDCEMFTCGKGAYIEGSGHNVNSFIGCHTKSCDIGLEIENSSNTRVIDATFETCDIGIDLTTAPGRESQFFACYFEDTVTAAIRVGVGVLDTCIYWPLLHADVIIDNGTDTKRIPV